MLGVAVVVVDVVVVVVQAVVLLVLMVVVKFVVSRLPRPLSDNLVEQITEGLGILMGVGGVRMELGIVVMLVDVVVSVFIDLHITWVEFMLVLELFVTLVLLLGGFILVAFFILIIAPPQGKPLLLLLLGQGDPLLLLHLGNQLPLVVLIECKSVSRHPRICAHPDVFL